MRNGLATVPKRKMYGKIPQILGSMIRVIGKRVSERGAHTNGKLRLLRKRAGNKANEFVFM